MPAGPRMRNVTFCSGDAVLAGSLVLPGQDAPSAGVVMVSGSGPADRNNDTYFPPIRRHLADAGIAVLSYDKRGVGSSSGDWQDSAVADLSADALAALDFLRAQPQVPADAAGLFGHSEGGWVVLCAAASRADVPWVITNSGPGTTLAAQERHALGTALRRASTQDASRTLALYDQLVLAGRRGSGFAEAVRLIDAARPPPAFASYWSGVDERYWEFLKRNQDYDPLPDALRLGCPHLAIFGGADERLPVPDSIRLFSTAACHRQRERRAPLTVEVFPGASHRIQTETGTRLASGYLDTLTQWIKARTNTSPGP